MIAAFKKIKIHFIGIGGIGMSGIAEVLLTLGYKVSGSDIAMSENVEKLKQCGAEIFLGHREENVLDAGVVVYTTAVNEFNPEMIKAKMMGIPIVKRAEMLAELMRLKMGLAVAGTHGKTTTTSFLSTILQEAGLNPTYLIGGIVKNLNGHAKVGSGEFLVAEADESDGTFLLLNPVMSVITNIDNDHLDFYQNEENLFKAFTEFAQKIPFYGVVSLNSHDDLLMKISRGMKKPWTTYGIENDAHFVARNIHYEKFHTEYDLYYKNEFQMKMKILIPGRHNVLNSLGALSLAFYLGIDFATIRDAICKFDGVGRRFQLLYQNEQFELIDDYGHHPTEIASTLKILKMTRADKKRIAIFQPHRFSRTRDCWDQFLHCFNDADELYVLPIYAASEKPIDEINAERLVNDINQKHPKFATYMARLEDLPALMQKLMTPNVSVITLGAGNISKAARDWVAGQVLP